MPLVKHSRGSESLAGAQRELVQDITGQLLKRSAGGATCCKIRPSSGAPSCRCQLQLEVDWRAFNKVSIPLWNVSCRPTSKQPSSGSASTTPRHSWQLQQRFTGQVPECADRRAPATLSERCSNPLSRRCAPLEQHGATYGRAPGRVAEVMTREVRVANPDDSVQQIAQIMREADTGALPVGEGDRLVVGMVTDRDVAVGLVAEGRDPARTKVREVMSKEVRYVFEDEDLEHVAENMAEQQVRRLPVMNRQKRLVGIVSLGDIAKGRQSPLAGRALSGITRQGGQHTGGLSSSGRSQMVDQGNLPKDVPASDRDRQREIAARVGGTGYQRG